MINNMGESVYRSTSEPDFYDENSHINKELNYKETKLLSNQSFAYLKLVSGLVSLAKGHYSTREISQILQLSREKMLRLYKQNPRLPLPSDWDYISGLPIDTQEKEIFYADGKKKKMFDEDDEFNTLAPSFDDSDEDNIFSDMFDEDEDDEDDE